MMKEMKELTSNLPSAEDFIRALQGHYGHGQKNGDVLPSLALFGAGLLVGAGLALLLAPSSGEELRENLGERLGAIREHASANGEEASPSGAAS